uniref:DUF1738 domain-containing protein n=1 Tax=Angiostrongylus cantonensis TaxID=6313 RepID=A0A0K0DHB4_ANGCA
MTSGGKPSTYRPMQMTDNRSRPSLIAWSASSGRMQNIALSNDELHAVLLLNSLPYPYYQDAWRRIQKQVKRANKCHFKAQLFA